MKIGDFAKKYGLNITTVRYYVERALLTPERKNNQYVFTPSCMEDMEKILKYKSFRFSLEEIELLFFLEKTTKFRDETVLGIFSRLLKQKQAELEKEEEKIHGDEIGGSDPFTGCSGSMYFLSGEDSEKGSGAGKYTETGYGAESGWHKCYG